MKEADKNKTEEKIDSYVGYFGVSHIAGAKAAASCSQALNLSLNAQKHTHTWSCAKQERKDFEASVFMWNVRPLFIDLQG